MSYSNKNDDLSDFNMECDICKKDMNEEYCKNNHNRPYCLLHMQIVMPYIYLGNELNASRLEELKYFNINTIVNVACNVENYYLDLYNYIKYEWDDALKFNISKEIDEIVETMHKLVVQKKNVLIHCALGISRSPSVIIAYMIKYGGYTCQNALERLKQIRHYIQPNINFIQQLIEYEKQCTSNKRIKIS